MKMPCLLVVVALAGLVGCGQKGPLVLPDAQHPHKRIGAPKPPAAPTPVSPAPGPATPATAPTPQQ